MNTLIDAGIGEYRGGFYQGPIAHLMVVAHFVQKSTMDKLTAGQPCEKWNLAHEGYLSLLADEDHSPGELAERLGIRKQACSKTLKQLEALGLVARRKNPGDSRSSLMSLTDKGLQLRQDSIRASNEIYRHFATDVDAERMQQLVEILAGLRAKLGIELERRGAPEPGPRNACDRSKSLNLLLPGLVSHFRQALMTSLSDKGFEDLKFSFSPILGLLNHEERKIQYIASVIGVSKQAIASTAADLEGAGYITRKPDPFDKRQIVLSLTSRGRDLLKESVVSVRSLEASVKDLLSDDEFQLMDDTLATLYLQVAEHYDTASVLPAKIQQISEQLLAELGVAGVRVLTRHLMTITGGKS